MSDLPQRSGRVSTLELFFDLVFVFTITQLTGVLVDGEEKAIGDPYDPLHGWIALGLGAGAALFILRDPGLWTHARPRRVGCGLLTTGGRGVGCPACKGGRCSRSLRRELDDGRDTSPDS